MKKKTLALLLACCLAIGVAAGGTLAWLTDDTEPVTNTFTPSDINIDLNETTGNEYKMIPNHTLTKDPKVTVNVGSEACWLFIKIKETGGVVEYTPAGSAEKKTTAWGDFMTYEIATGVNGKTWTQLTGVDAGKLDNGEKVYYIQVEDLTGAGAEKVVYGIIKDNTVNVKDSVTKEMMNALTEETYPKLTFIAYATQYYSSNNTPFTAAEAWQKTAGYVAPTT